MDGDHRPEPTASADQLLRLAAVPPDRIAEAALLAASAMRDNPLHAAALGDDPARRVRVMRAVFERHLASPRRSVHGVWAGGSLIGLAGSTSPGDCRPSLRELAGLVPALGIAGRRTRRLIEWQRAWSRAEPDAPHAHLGPVAVAVEHRRRGVGSMLLAHHTARLDATGQRGYLETDRPENVRFYEAHGFVVTHCATVIGVQNWFMSRTPRSSLSG